MTLQEGQSIRYIESYIPSWLARDAGYLEGFKQRLEALMQMQDYDIIHLGEPKVIDTYACPPAPGMCTMRVEAVVSEFDCVLPMSEEEDE